MDHVNETAASGLGEEQGLPPRKAKGGELWEWTKALAIALAVALGIRWFLFAPFVVDGSSMLPNLHDRDRLIVNKLAYRIGEPKRGDVVVVYIPSEDRDFIKRVIAVGGETVEMKNDVLYINGKPVEEPYLKRAKEEAHARGELYTLDFGPVTVPEGHVFVLGDNRGNSKDSRLLGPLPLEHVVGRADVIFWPLKDFGWVR
ncbi:signal peptidase I [Calditerricola satsumensis]|nr:signal peptidase I [Calditerricola satsumensis]